jgi:hypothetical protein
VSFLHHFADQVPSGRQGRAPEVKGYLRRSVGGDPTRRQIDSIGIHIDQLLDELVGVNCGSVLTEEHQNVPYRLVHSSLLLRAGRQQAQDGE